MPKGRNHLNTIYISERLQECLRPISQCALTTVTAPMGYGKTTAVNWYLSRQLKAEQAVQVRISIYSDNLPIFWKSVQQAFAFAGLDFLDGCECRMMWHLRVPHRYYLLCADRKLCVLYFY